MTDADKVATILSYALTGELTGVRRRNGAGADLQTKSRAFDSLGRLVAQTEPNSGTSRYAWDDGGRLSEPATRGVRHQPSVRRHGSPAREDYSPCEATHPAYTPPDLITGNGVEVAYTYDAYDAGQVSPALCSSTTLP